MARQSRLLMTQFDGHQNAKMNGYQAAAIRALPRPDAISVVIIAMTADVLENDVEQSLEQGMDAHVAKPFDTRQFLFLLRGLLQNKEI